MKTILAKEQQVYPCRGLFGAEYTERFEISLRDHAERIKQNLGLQETPVQLGYNRESREKTVKFSGISGVLTVGDIQIEIMPKFYSSDDYWRESLLNIIYISHCGRIHPQFTSNTQKDKLRFYDHIGLLFAEELEQALTHDRIQRYQTEENSSCFLRGRLLIGTQLRHLISHPGRLYYEQSVLSEDNAFNYLLRWCTETLCSVVRSPVIKRRLLSVLAVLPVVKQSYKIPVNMHLPPQYQYYRGAVRIANDLAAGISSTHKSNGSDGYGYIIATAPIYEKFVERTLKQLTFQGFDVQVQPQVSSIFAVAQDPGMSSFYTRPDNKLFFNGKELLLVDAKYKNNFTGSNGKKPVSSDAYQMFSSLVSHRCNRGILISPCDENVRTCTKMWRINAENKEYVIALILLNLHNVSTNSAFASLKHDLENEILKVMRS